MKLVLQIQTGMVWVPTFPWSFINRQSRLKPWTVALQHERIVVHMRQTNKNVLLSEAWHHWWRGLHIMARKLSGK